MCKMHKVTYKTHTVHENSFQIKLIEKVNKCVCKCGKI